MRFITKLNPALLLGHLCMICIGSVRKSERSDVIFVLANRPHARSRLACLYNARDTQLRVSLVCRLQHST